MARIIGKTMYRPTPPPAFRAPALSAEVWGSTTVCTTTKVLLPVGAVVRPPRSVLLVPGVKVAAGVGVAAGVTVLVLLVELGVAEVDGEAEVALEVVDVAVVEEEEVEEVEVAEELVVELSV